MSLRGIEYAHSNQKRIFDLFVAGVSAPAESVFRYFFIRAAASQGITADNAIFLQRRTGAHDDPFYIEKYRVKDPSTGQPFSSKLAKVALLGLDELTNRSNIQRGEMSVTGWRPLLITEEEEFRSALPSKLRQRYEQVVVPTRPGVVSSFGIEAHAGTLLGLEHHEQRAEQNIQDVIDGSLAHDLRLVARLFEVAVARRLPVPMN